MTVLILRLKINTTKILILTSLITQLTQEPASAKAHSCNKKSAKSLCLQLLHQGKIKATVSYKVREYSNTRQKVHKASGVEKKQRILRNSISGALVLQNGMPS